MFYNESKINVLLHYTFIGGGESGDSNPCLSCHGYQGFPPAILLPPSSSRSQVCIIHIYISIIISNHLMLNLVVI